MISRRVTIAIPIHNEEEVLPALLQRVFAVLDQTPGGPHELLIVDDGSRDGSLRILEDAAATRSAPARHRAVPKFRAPGRRVGGLRPRDRRRDDGDGRRSAGCSRSPARSSSKRLDEGFDVVYVRRTRRKEAFLAAHELSPRVSDHRELSKLALPVDAGDFALLSRRAVDAVRALPERQRYLRGLRSWVGFRQTGEVIERHARAAGESKYSVSALIGLALDGTFAFSTAPLRFIGAARRIRPDVRRACFRSMPCYVRVVLGRSPQGFTALTVLVTIIGGMILISLWIIGEYVGRIYEEVKRRPIYLVDRTVGGARRPAAARLMDPRYGAQYARLYREHWWWRAREEYLTRLLDRLIGADGAGETFDFGCGDGLFFPILQRYGAERPRGLEHGRVAARSGGPVVRPHHDGRRSSTILRSGRATA